MKIYYSQFFLKNGVFLFLLLLPVTLFIYGDVNSKYDSLLTFTYVLQPEQLAASKEKVISTLYSCGRKWIILDSYFSVDGKEWNRDEIAKMRSALPDRKILAYLSIGEAENYRPYWDDNWDKNNDGRPDLHAPSWLCNENPDWKGNYKVKYWISEWQNIIIEMLNNIINAGFDGVYMDIVDAFEFFEYDNLNDEWIDYRANPETGNAYRHDMVEWVNTIATQARTLNPAFMIIPQNGAQLLEYDNYRAIINGIGVEDLFTQGNIKQDPSHTSYVIGFLDLLKGSGKPVLLIEYGDKAKSVKLSVKGAFAKGYTLLITGRELKTLGTCPIVTKKNKKK